MAETFSSSSSSSATFSPSASASSVTSLPVLFNPQSLLSNTILTKENYLNWSSQFLAVLCTHSLEHVVHDKNCPLEKLDDKTINPEYTKWKSATSLVLTWIRATVSSPVQNLLVSCKAAPEAWDILHNRFASSSKTHIRTLKNNLHTLKKEANTSISDFLLRAKTISDSLASAGCIIPESDLIDHILDGLGTDFKEFITSFHLHPQVSFDEFHDLLIQEETLQTRFSSLSISPSTALVAASQSQRQTTNTNSAASQNKHTQNFHQRSQFHRNNGSNRNNRPNNFIGSNRNNSNRPNNFNRQHGSQPPRFIPNNDPPLLPTPVFQSRDSIVCQLCDQSGHIAKHCARNSRPPFTAEAHVSTPTWDTNWCLDSGATNHMTSSATNLTHSQPYQGENELVE